MSTNTWRKCSWRNSNAYRLSSHPICNQSTTTDSARGSYGRYSTTCFRNGGRFDRSMWEAYVAAKKLFFQKVIEVINPDDDFVWIHDYHLMVLPTFLRRRFNRIRMVFFLLGQGNKTEPDQPNRTRSDKTGSGRVRILRKTRMVTYFWYNGLRVGSGKKHQPDRVNGYPRIK